MTEDSTKGRLLVATPSLLDPNFDRTVLLMLEHTAMGALGVVLDRSGGGPPVGPLESWSLLLSEPAELFFGGPVERDSVVAVGRLHPGASLDTAAAVTERLVVVDLRPGPDEVLGHLDALRMFRGYAGWSPGQLEDELAEQAWLVLDAADDDPFNADPGSLWRDVLRRQGGSLSRWADLMPPDLSAN